MKKSMAFLPILALAIVFALTMSCTDAAYGADYTKTIDAAPFLENDRAFDTVRPIAETFGIYVSWDQESQQVTLTRGMRQVVMQLGSFEEIVVTEDGVKTIAMDVAPILKDGRVFLPVRLWAEHFGLSVTWLEENRSVIVSEGKKALTVIPGENEIKLSGGYFLKVYDKDDSLRFFYPEIGVLGLTWEGYAEVILDIDGGEYVIAAVHSGVGRSDPVQHTYEGVSAQVYQNAEINNTNVTVLPDHCYGAPAFKVEGIVSSIPQAGVVFLHDTHICGLAVEVKRAHSSGSENGSFDLEEVLEIDIAEPGEAEHKPLADEPVVIDPAQLSAELVIVNALLDEIMASFSII
ncbi:MAG: copper amine oxidase N-terminal domain-containing protein [Clostridiales bacterium]|nr:copper amine oxidase N-terminal domain-containing protein [Clostridiales bacterium]